MHLVAAMLKTEGQGIDLGEGGLVIAGVIILLVLGWLLMARATPKK